MSESFPLKSNQTQRRNSYEPKKLSIIQKIRNFIESDGFHKFIITLVIIDCLCVASEILLGELEKYLIPSDPCALKVEHHAKLHSNLTTSHHNESLHTKHSSGENHHESNHLLHHIFEIIEIILSTTTLSILGKYLK